MGTSGKVMAHQKPNDPARDKAKEGSQTTSASGTKPRVKTDRVKADKAKTGKRRPSLLARFQRRSTTQSSPAKPPKPRRIDVLFKGDASVDSTQASKADSLITDSAETLLGSKLLFNLVLVRPWILVCGFWLLLLGTSAIALSGLADPGKPTVSAPSNGEVQPLQPLGVAPDTAVTSRLAESPVALNGGETIPSPHQPLPLWSLWVMVGACAAGCTLLSRPELITFGTPERRRPSRAGGKLTRTADSRQSSQRRAGKGQPNAPTPNRPQLKPNYPQGQVMAVSNPGSIQQVTPTRGAQPPARKLVSFDVASGSQPSAQGAQPQVSILPSSESNALDWQEGSLAHKLDVRQNRPLKSFL